VGGIEPPTRAYETVTPAETPRRIADLPRVSFRPGGWRWLAEDRGKALAGTFRVFASRTPLRGSPFAPTPRRSAGRWGQSGGVAWTRRVRFRALDRYPARTAVAPGGSPPASGPYARRQKRASSAPERREGCRPIPLSRPSDAERVGTALSPRPVGLPERVPGPSRSGQRRDQERCAGLRGSARSPPLPDLGQ
jgi:hypothetical protein